MDDQSYKLILEGKLREGVERPLAVRKLSALLKRDVEAVAELLSGNPLVFAQGLDYRNALRYQSLLASAGALSRIESETRVAGPLDSLDQTLPSQSEASSSDVSACPKCGYLPTGEGDALLIRGECPRCGLKVVSRIAEDPESESRALLDEDFLSARPEAPAIYSGRTPASWKRRALASVHTFSLFLAVYCCLLMLFIFSFVPLSSIPGYLGQGFLDAAFVSFPILLPALAIILISFVFPLFNRGLSWGQDKMRIAVWYTEEAQIGGLHLALAFRAVAIEIVSFAPGLMALWLVPKLGVGTNVVTANAVRILLAILSWIISWVYLLRNPDKRGILDRAGGTIQTEEGPLPEHALKEVLMPICLVAGISMILGVLLPLCSRALR
jgi:uncharacterized membrane protein (DUF485 family)